MNTPASNPAWRSLNRIVCMFTFLAIVSRWVYQGLTDNGSTINAKSERIPAIIVSPPPRIKPHLSRTNLVIREEINGKINGKQEAYLLLNNGIVPILEFDDFALRKVVQDFEVSHGRVTSWKEEVGLSSHWAALTTGIRLTFEPIPKKEDDK